MNQEQNDIAIRVENLSKCYQIYETPRDRLKQFILPRIQRVIGKQPKQYFREFWALRDISFEVKKGETVGIVGRNGAGKSTLLQMICSTLSPTSGNITTHGRIAALLELGSGFNPEFTGRENVYMNASVLGLSEEEIDTRFDDIAAFADIGDFIEQPVKTYSSGMMVRLAFAVQAQVEPNILIVDEALSVGDIRFQAKCIRTIENLKNKGTSILFVTHSTGQIEAICDHAIWIENGSIKRYGSPKDIMRKYINYIEHGIDETPIQDTSRPLTEVDKGIKKGWIDITDAYNIVGDQSAVIRKIMVTIEDDLLVFLEDKESKISIALNLDVKETIQYPLIAFGIFNALNEPIIHFNNENTELRIEPLIAGFSYVVTVSFNIPALKLGEYLISIGIDDGFMGENQVIFHLYDAWPFSVILGSNKRTQAGYIQINPDNIQLNTTMERSE